MNTFTPMNRYVKFRFNVKYTIIFSKIISVLFLLHLTNVLHAQCTDIEIKGVYIECNTVGGNSSEFYIDITALPSAAGTYTIKDNSGNVADVTWSVTIPLDPTDPLTYPTYEFGPFTNGDIFDVVLLGPNACEIPILKDDVGYQCVNNNSGYCELDVPFYDIDFTGNPTGAINVNSFVREGFCCGLRDNNTERCVEFRITLDDNVEGLEFNATGPTALGSQYLYYSIAGMEECCTEDPPFCDPSIDTDSDGENDIDTDNNGVDNIQEITTPLCLGGNNTYTIYWCKPGNSAGELSISLIPEPGVFPQPKISQNCETELEVVNMQNPTWTSPDDGDPNTCEDPLLDNFTMCNLGDVCNMVSFLYDSTIFGDLDDSFCDGKVFRYVVSGTASSDCSTGSVSAEAFVRVYPEFEIESISLQCQANTDPEMLTLTASLSGLGSTCDYIYRWADSDVDTLVATGVNLNSISVLNNGKEYFLTVKRVSDIEECAAKSISITASSDCCEADAGDIVAPLGTMTKDSICFGNDVGAYVVNYLASDEVNPGNTDYQYIFLLANNNGTIVNQQTSGDFDFSNLASGTYNIYGLSYSTFNTPNNVTAYLSGITGDVTMNDITQIETDESGAILCLDLEGLDNTGVQAQLTVNSLLSCSVNDNDLDCFGDSNGELIAVPSGGTGPYTYLWNDTNGQTTSTATSLGSGTYTVTVTDANNCQTTCTATITQPSAALSGECTGSSLSCFGDMDGDVSVVASNGTGPYTYLWNDTNGQTTSTATSLGSGTYTVTVTDANNCQTTCTATITQPSAALSGECTGSSLSCFGDMDGDVSVVASNGTGPYTYLWNDTNGQTTSTATSLGSGTYTVTVTDANNCQTTCTATITQPSAALSAECTGSSLSCFGDMDGDVSVVALNGTGPYTYLWNDTNGQTTSTATSLGSGTYTVTVTDANNCQTTCTATITQPVAALSAECTGSSLSCFGDMDGDVSVVASNGTGPYTYLWNDTNGQTTSTATSLGSGTYTVTVTDANNCQTTCTATITQPVAALSAECTGSSLSCFGDMDGDVSVVASNGTGPYTYLWNDTNGQTTSTATSLGSGTYTVTVTDANNCQTTCTATITQPSAALSAECTGSSLSCFGDMDGDVSVVALNGTGPYTYLWNDTNGQTTSTATSLGSGTYTVTVTDANNCQTTCTATITQPSAALSGECTGSSLSCFGDMDGDVSVVASNGTGPYTYLWNDTNGQTTSTATSLGSGTYTVTVTDANNCQTTCTATITQPSAALSAECTGSSLSCFGDMDGDVSVVALNGTGPYTYLWNDTNGQTTSTATSLGSGTYTVTVTDANNCQTTCTATITQPVAALSAECTGSSLSCFGDMDGDVSVVASNGTGPYTYLWNDTNGQTTSTATSLGSGTYTVTVTDANNCQTTCTATITQPVAALSGECTGSSLSCFGDMDGDVSVVASNGTGPYTYLWNDTNGQTTSTATSLGSGTYTVTVTDANNCQTTCTATITQPSAALSAECTGSSLSCFGDMDGDVSVVALNGTGPYTYLWNDTNGQTTSTATSLGSGTYTVTVTDANNCQTTCTATITQPVAALSAECTGSSLSCFGDMDGDVSVVASNGTGPYTYLWNDTNGQTTSTATSLGSGTYTVTVTDANNCQTTCTATITQPSAALSAECTGSSLSCFGDMDGDVSVVALNGTGPYTYLWNDTNGQTTSTATSLGSGTYTVTVTDANNCQTTCTATITQPSAALSAECTGSSLSCFGDTDGAVSVSGTGGTGSYTYNWESATAIGTSIGTSSTVSNLESGTYNVTVTDANGCSITCSSIISEPTLLTASCTGELLLCNGDTNGDVSVSATGGTGSYTYNWESATAIGTSIGTSSTVSNLESGTYNVTVTDANECSITCSSIISEPTLLTANCTGELLLCNGDTNGDVSVSATGGTGSYTYNWESATAVGTSIGTTSNISNLSAGNYNVTVSDANNCTATCTAMVTEPNPLTVTCSGDLEVCENTLGINYSAQMGMSSYSWTITGNGVISGIATEQNVLVDAGASGSYTLTVTVTDANSCTASCSRIVTINASPIATPSGPNQVCLNETININGNPSGGSGVYIDHLWTDLNSGTASGYTLNNNLNQLVTIDATGAISGTINLQYQVTDDNDCVGMENVTINVIDLPTLAINNIECAPDLLTYNIELITNGGSVLSSAGIIIDNGGGSFSMTGIPTTENVTITVTDNASNCSFIQVVNAPDCSCPNVNAPVNSGDIIICQGDNIPLLEVSVGVGETVDWYDDASGGNLLASGTTTFSASVSGTYYAEARVIVSGCISNVRTPVNLQINDAPVSNVSDKKICIQKIIDIDGSPLGGSGVYVSHQWIDLATGTSSGYVLSNLSGQVISVNTNFATAGTVELSYTVIDNQGCTTTALITLTIDPLPVCEIIGDDEVCSLSFGNTFSGPPGMNSYEWTVSGSASILGPTNMQNVSIDAGSSGSFALTLLIADDNTCTSFCTKNISINGLPSCTIIGDDEVCSMSSQNIFSGPSGMSAYQWTIIGNGNIIGSINSQSVSVDGLLGGSFTLSLEVEDINGCSSTCDKFVSINPLPNCNFTGPQVVCENSIENIFLGPSGMSSYQWTIVGDAVITGLANSQDVIINPTGVGSFSLSLEVIDENGCSHICTKNITVGENPVCSISGVSEVCEFYFGLNFSGPLNADSYQWSISGNANIIGVSNNENVLVNVFLSGDFTLTLTTIDGDGCPSTCSKTVVINPLPELSIINVTCDPSLLNYTVNLSTSGSILNASLGEVISNGSGSFSIINIPAGNAVTITSTDQNGCISSQSINAPDCSCPVINAPVSSGDQQICNGAPFPELIVDINTDETADWYSLPIGGTLLAEGIISYTPTSAGIFYVESRSLISNCVSAFRTPVILMINNNPIANPMNQAICIGGNLSINGNPSNGSGNYVSHDWNDLGTGTAAGYELIGTTNQVLMINTIDATGGNIDLEYMVVDDNGCEGIGFVTIVLNELPLCNITGLDAICEGPTGQIYEAPDGMNTYSWTVSGPVEIIGVSNSSQIEIQTTASGSFTLNLEVMDTNGCSSVCTKTVTINPNPICNITGPNEVCEETIGQVYVGPIGMALYNWSISGDGEIIGNSNSEEVEIQTTGIDDFILTLEITDENGCLSICNKMISINSLPACSIVGTDEVCESTTGLIFFAPTGMASYNWSINGDGEIIGASDNGQVEIQSLTSGDFTLTLEVTNSDGCLSICNKTVLVNSNPVCSITGVDGLCEFSEGQIFSGPSGMNSYTWTIIGNAIITSMSNTQDIEVSSTSSGSFVLTLIVEDGNTCITECSKTIVVNPLPTLSITTISCTPDLLNYTIDLNTNATNVLSSLGLVVENGGGSFSITNIPEGEQVSISAISLEGCIVSQMVNAPDCNCPNIDAAISGGDQQVCEGEVIPNLNVSVSLGQTADWYDQAGGGTLLASNTTSYTPNAAGTFYVEAREIASGCTSNIRIPITLTINPTPNPSIPDFGVIDVKSCDSNTGAIIIQGLVSGQEYLVEYTHDGNPMTFGPVISTNDIVFVNNLSVGSYDDIVVIHSSNNCASSVISGGPFILEEPPLEVPLILQASASGPTTCSGSDGFIIIESLIPNDEYTIDYLFNGMAQTISGLVADNNGFILLQNLSAGSYSNFELINNTTTCVATPIIDPILLTDPEVETVTINSLNTTSGCGLSDGSILLEGLIPGGEYDLSFIQNGMMFFQNNLIANPDGTILLSGLEAGAYSSFIFTNNFTTCVSNSLIGPFFLEDPSAPQTPDFENDIVEVCVGETFQFNIITPSTLPAGASIVWTGPNGFQSDEFEPTINDVSNLNNGSYQAIIVLNNCSSIPGMLNVSVNEAPSDLQASNIGSICDGDDVQLFANNTNPNASYIWYDGIPGLPGVNIISTDQNPILSGLDNANGPYSFWVQANIGTCFSNVDSTTVQVNSLPLVDPQATLDPCGETLALFANPDPVDNGNDYIYQWTGPNGFNSDEANPVLTNLTEDNLGNYELVITNSNACTSIFASILIDDLFELPIPSLDITPDQEICEGSAIELSTQIYDGQVVNYTWVLNGNTISTTTSSSLTIDPVDPNIHTGEYQVIVNVDGCDSDTSASILIIVTPSPMTPLITTDEELCEGESIQLETSFISGASYSWTGPNGFNSVEQNPIIDPANANNSGVYELIVTVNGCSSPVASVSVIVNAIPGIPLAANNTLICEGQTLNLFVDNSVTGAIYEWFNEDTGLSVGFGANLTLPNATTNETGSYYVVVTQNTCIFDPTIENDTEAFTYAEVISVEGAFAETSFDDTICVDNYNLVAAEIPLDFEAFTSTMWNVENGGTATVQFPEESNSPVVNLEFGENIFTWTVSNEICGTTSLDSMIITYDPGPDALDDIYDLEFNTSLSGINVLENDTYISLAEGVVITSNPDNGILSINDNGTYTYTPFDGFFGTDEFTYTICSEECPDECDIAQVIINIEPNLDCIIPNIITPNGDGLNDTFIVPCTDIYPGSSLVVFNRWGDEIFRSPDYQNDWGGTYEGNDLPVGSYFYILILNDEVKSTFKGYVYIQKN